MLRGGEDSGRVHFADAIVERIRDVDIPRAVHRHGEGSEEGAVGRRTVIAGECESPVAGQGADDSRRVHLADSVTA